MKKTIYLALSTLEQIREGVRLKFKDHPQNHILGKSQQMDYEPFQEIIQKELKEKLYTTRFMKVRSEAPDIWSRITYFTLWTIFYDNVKNPEKRKRMHRDTIRMFMLFAFDEIREDLLVDTPPLKENFLDFESALRKTGEADSESLIYTEDISESIIIEAMEKAQVEIKILDTFLNKWNSFKPALKDAAARGCKIRILISDPHVKPIVNRSKHVLAARRDSNGLPQLRHTILEDINSWEKSNSVEFAEYDCLPGFNLYAVDDTYFFSVFWYKLETILGPHLVIEDDHPIKKQIDEHFENIWEEAYDLRTDIRRKPEINLSDRLKKYVGHWYLYCNRGSKEKESYQLRFMEQGIIAENLLILQPNGYQLQATFASSVKGKLSGYAEIHPIHDEFLEVKLRKPFEKDSVYFLMHIGPNNYNHIIGVYNYKYTQHPMLGTGLAGMVKVKKGDLVNIETKILSNHQRFFKEIGDKSTQKLLRYLTFPLGTRIEAVNSLDDPDLRERYSKPFKYRGVYKMYSHRGGKENSFIFESLMKIDGFQQIIHRRSGGKYSISSKGKAELMKDDNMLLAFKNLENRKLGIMFVRCNIHEPKPQSYYIGIFSGFGIENSQRVLGSRVILEYLGRKEELFEQAEIKEYTVGSSEFNRLPDEIRLNLAGRTQNSIGFYHFQGANSQSALKNQAKKELSMGQIYFESACQKALSNDLSQVEAAIAMFELALKHGFESKEVFVQKLEEFEDDGWIGRKMKKRILNHLNF